MTRTSIIPFLRLLSLPQRNLQTHRIHSSTPYSGIWVRHYQPVAQADPMIQPVGIRSRIYRTVAFGAFGLCFLGLGFMVAVSPLVPALLDATRHRSDGGVLHDFMPEENVVGAIGSFINNHPMAVEMRLNPDMIEFRPQMRLSDALRRHNLTSTTLLGPGRITVHPVCWIDKEGKSLVSIFHIGADVCGHPGIVHGGLLATILDEGLARCCFNALPNNVGVTAKLEIDYRKPVYAGKYIVLRARTINVEGRKVWVEGQLESLPSHGQQPKIFAQASALFISPRIASIVAQLQPS